MMNPKRFFNFVISCKKQPISFKDKGLKILIFLAVTFLLLNSWSLSYANVYLHEAMDIDGNLVSLADFKGKILLVVNIDTSCGHEEYMKKLEELYQKYKDQGFEILAFPKNNSKGCEPGTNEKIKKICRLDRKTTFPLFEKSTTHGNEMIPLYKYLTKESFFKGRLSCLNKFLVDSNGNVVARYHATDPHSEELNRRIKTLLPSPKKRVYTVSGYITGGIE